MPRTTVRVVCGREEVIATLVPTRALVRVDLPAFGRPTKHAKPLRKSGTSRSAQPGRAEREVGVPFRVRLDREHLVQLDLVALERQPGAGHVEAPSLGGALAGLRA